MPGILGLLEEATSHAAGDVFSCGLILIMLCLSLLCAPAKQSSIMSVIVWDAARLCVHVSKHLQLIQEGDI